MLKKLQEDIHAIALKLSAELPEDIKETFVNCFISTIDTTINYDDNKFFMITGDIPALWLRDSLLQVEHYLPFMDESPSLKAMIKDLLDFHMKAILIDPYANAFNKEANGMRIHHDDVTSLKDEIWERKYELDSLCASLRLLSLYIENTGDYDYLDDSIVQVINLIVETMIVEQNHNNSPYQFFRPNTTPHDTLSHDGLGSPFGYTGMSWSGFRPSDDSCTYHYLIPANFYALATIDSTRKLLKRNANHQALLDKIEILSQEIKQGIDTYGVIDHPKHGKIYAFEVDGLGNQLLMDDANMPSLLSLPYFDKEAKFYDRELYVNTRKYLLSDENPYYFK